jgi:hypothetical protein
MALSRTSLGRLILVPALITLAVTLVRLVGELSRWSPSLFNRAPGGPGALVGIVWLIPVFGIYFALRLARTGDRPTGVGRTLAWAALALVLNTAVFIASIKLFPLSPVVQLGLFTLGSWLAIAVARPGWPALWRVLLAYALAARIPVLVVMFFAIFLGWDTHYAKPRPDFPPMGHWGLFFWTAFLPQMSVWIYLTIVGGMIFGALALGVRRLLSGRAGEGLPGASVSAGA